MLQRIQVALECVEGAKWLRLCCLRIPIRSVDGIEEEFTFRASSEQRNKPRIAHANTRICYDALSHSRCTLQPTQALSTWTLVTSYMLTRRGYMCSTCMYDLYIHYIIHCYTCMIRFVHTDAYTSLCTKRKHTYKDTCTRTYISVCVSIERVY